MSHQPDPLPDFMALCYVVDLLVAHLVMTGTRGELLALHRDLHPLGVGRPGIREVVDALLDVRPQIDRWRAYNQAEAAAAAWAQGTKGNG